MPSHLAVASRGLPTLPNAFARGIQRPTGGPCHPTPKIRGKHPTPKSVNTQRPKLNTQRPKKFLPLRGVFLYRGCWDPARCLGGRRRLGALFPFPLGAAAAGSGSAARSGGGVGARAARNRRRESDPTPSSVGPGGDPAAHPTPTAPNALATQRSAIARPTGHP